jgi:hypothetical protein
MCWVVDGQAGWAAAKLRMPRGESGEVRGASTDFQLMDRDIEWAAELRGSERLKQRSLRTLARLRATGRTNKKEKGGRRKRWP